MDQSPTTAQVPPNLIEAALNAAREQGGQVADIAIGRIAAHAGMSRSTLLRRLGGTRQPLDDAVRAAGIDPGGQPVRQRALAAAADLISDVGLANVTLDAIAARANCSVDSLYAMIGNRDVLLAAVFAEHSPLTDIDQALVADVSTDTDLTETVHHLYTNYASALLRGPRLTPALIAEALSRPGSPITHSVLELNAPSLIAPLRNWLTTEINRGRIRDLPPTVLLYLLLAPLLMYTLLQPTVARIDDEGATDINDACILFAEAFIRAAGQTPQPSPPD